MNIQTKKVPISQVRIDPNNPRSLNKEKFKKLKSSVKEFPEMLEVRPLVVAEGVVVGGNMRLLAMKDLGYREVSVIDVTEWTQEKRDEFMIKDNLSFGDWDYDLLANEWNIDDLTDWGMDLWDTEPEEMQGLTDEDDVPEAPEEPITKLGDVWILGEHRVMCGDSTSKEAVEILMDGEKADLLFTDPPYGISVVSKKGNIGKGVLAKEGKYREVIGDDTYFDPTYLLSIGNKQIIWGANYFHDKLPLGTSWIVWDKDRPTGTTFSDCELAWTNKKGVAIKKYKCTWNGMVREGESGKRVHPTQKPLKITVEVLIDFSENKDLILDLFLGSGSTLIAAEKTNRKCYGMELDPKYCDVIVKRWEDFTGKKATREIDDLEVMTQAH